MNADNLLQTIDLCRYYRRGEHQIRALDHIDLSLRRGELLAVVGSSGSGKSTLLNLMAGLDTPTSGRVVIGGRALGEMSRRELSAFRAGRIGMVFQSFNLLPHLSALRNVELALYFTSAAKRERRKMAGEMLERLGLGERLHHLPGELSGGEQQRVAMARALIKKPEIVYADEPTGNLDFDNATQLGKLLADLNSHGLTVVIATHDLTLAQQIGHRRIHLRYGCLIDDPDFHPEEVAS